MHPYLPPGRAPKKNSTPRMLRQALRRALRRKEMEMEMEVMGESRLHHVLRVDRRRGDEEKRPRAHPSRRVPADADARPNECRTRSTRGLGQSDAPKRRDDLRVQRVLRLPGLLPRWTVPIDSLTAP
jgi:hypothetical protein